MALTFGTIDRLKIQRRWLTIIPVTLDNAYPAGGWPITAAQVGMSSISNITVLDPGQANFQWVSSTSKLKAYYYDYNNAADGLAIEIVVGDTAILNGVVITLMCFGV